MAKASDMWWTINGEELLKVLRRASEGEDVDLLYLELVANSDVVEEDEDTDEGGNNGE